MSAHWIGQQLRAAVLQDRQQGRPLDPRRLQAVIGDICAGGHEDLVVPLRYLVLSGAFASAAAMEPPLADGRQLPRLQNELAQIYAGPLCTRLEPVLEGLLDRPASARMSGPGPIPAGSAPAPPASQPAAGGGGNAVVIVLLAGLILGAGGLLWWGLLARRWPGAEPPPPVDPLIPVLQAKALELCSPQPIGPARTGGLDREAELDLPGRIRGTLSQRKAMFSQLRLGLRSPAPYLADPGRDPLSALIAWSFQQPQLNPATPPSLQEPGPGRPGQPHLTVQSLLCPALRDALRQQWLAAGPGEPDRAR